MIRKTLDNKNFFPKDVAPVRRDTINKTAFDSFTKTVISSVKQMMARGHSFKECAAKFNIDPSTLKKVLAHDTSIKVKKLAEKKHIPQKDRELNSKEIYAQNAYDSLYGIKTKTSNIKNPPNLSSKRILSNKGNYITDIGGPSKQIGHNSNTIFEPNKLSKLAKIKDNGERIRETREIIAKHKESIRLSSKNIAPNGKSLSKNDELSAVKSNAVTNASVREGITYSKKIPNNGISIFDNGVFERVPQKTKGEKRREKNKKVASKPKSRSWVKDGAKSLKSSDIVSKFIDSMIK